MAAPPLSMTSVLTTLAVAAGFVPPLAAAWTRRFSLRTPVGQVAFCWLVMALAGVVGWVRLFVLGLQPQTPISFLVTGLFPFLLLPPTLTWIGREAKRWQWPALAAWAIVWAVGAAGLLDVRLFRMLLDAPMSLAMCAVSVWALAAQVRRAPSRLVVAGWYWILVGHVVYFAADMVRSPLLEALAARHWDMVIGVHNGFMLLFVAIYLVIARGVLLPSTADAGPAAPAPVRQAA
jgi:hypothetical protein